MGRFSNLMSKAGEVVQQANQEYQRAKQQQQQQQQQQQSAQYGGQYGQQAQRDQRQYGTQPDHVPHHQRQYQTQPYSQQPTPTSASSWHQPHLQYNPQRHQQQSSDQLPEVPPYNLSQPDPVVDQTLAQTHADRQFAERLAAQYRQEAEDERKKADEELARLRAETEEMVKKQQRELEQQMQRLQVEEAPAVPSRSEGFGYIPPPPPGPPPGTTTGWDARPTLPPRPATVESRPGIASEVGSLSAQSSGQGYASMNEAQQQGMTAAVPQPVAQSPLSSDISPPREQHWQSYPPPPAAQSTLIQHPHDPPQPTLQHQKHPHPPQQSGHQQYFPPPPSQPSQTSPPQPSYSGAQEQHGVTRSRTPPPPQPHPSGILPLVECASDPITYDLHWAYHPDAPSSFICPKCYVDHIWDTQFRNTFTREFFTDRKPRQCLFGTRRVKDRLWPEAITSGNLAPVLAFLKHAPALDECPQSIVQEGRKWYTSADIPGMTMCSACFEFNLAGTSLEKHFCLETLQSAFCDSHNFYMPRLYDDAGRMSNWHAFVEGVKLRFELPQCPKQDAVKASSRAWYKSKRGPQGFQICVACYYDYFYGTPNEGFFEQVAGGDWDTMCIMRHLNIVIPTHHSLAKKDYDVFWTALDGIDAQPFCDGNGIKGGTWYTLPSDPPEFGVCGGCYAGIIQVLGGTKFFIPKRGISENDTLLCCFNLNHFRAQKYLTTYNESLMKGNWQLLSDFVTKFSTVPSCPRGKLIKSAGRRFWGWGVVAICEECYLTFAQGTALEPRFFLKGDVDAEGKSRMCDLYSPRMRGLYTQACRTGDLEGFLAYGEQRHVAWTQTISVCEQMLAQKKLDALQAKMLGMQGTFYKNLGMMSGATGPVYQVGSGYVNGWGLEGLKYDQQASAMAAGVMNPGNTMQVGMLERTWRENWE